LTDVTSSCQEDEKGGLVQQLRINLVFFNYIEESEANTIHSFFYTFSVWNHWRIAIVT